MTENTDTAASAAPADAAADAATEIATLRSKLAEAEKAVQEARVRAAAEFDNLRKRLERDAETSKKYGAERLLGELLGVSDSLELGLKAAQAPEATPKSIAEGVALTHKQLHAFFDKYGIKVVDPAGQPFNPELHEAVSMVESADVPANHVLAVMQKGYRLHERLLRPAMVVVARAPTAS
ncbi:MAG: nucleotide exchange factor GrpE [Nevskia sp.]|nr:nucleotide exchange factor GrpE [Nevskia sp.]